MINTEKYMFTVSHVLIACLLIVMLLFFQKENQINYSSIFNMDYVANDVVVYEDLCGSIYDIDFRNHLFLTREPGNKGIGTKGKLVLKEGRYDELNPLGTVEWLVEIEQDFVIQINDSELLRFIITFNMHHGGTGSFSRLFIFRCSDKRLEEIFQSGGEGMRVYQLPENRLKLTFGLWIVRDAHCCPSKRKVPIYRWNSKQNKYSLESENIYLRNELKNNPY